MRLLVVAILVAMLACHERTQPTDDIDLRIDLTSLLDSIDAATRATEAMDSAAANLYAGPEADQLVNVFDSASKGGKLEMATLSRIVKKRKELNHALALSIGTARTVNGMLSTRIAQVRDAEIRQAVAPLIAVHEEIANEYERVALSELEDSAKLELIVRIPGALGSTALTGDVASTTDAIRRISQLEARSNLLQAQLRGDLSRRKLQPIGRAF